MLPTTESIPDVQSTDVSDGAPSFSPPQTDSVDAVTELVNAAEASALLRLTTVPRVRNGAVGLSVADTQACSECHRHSVLSGMAHAESCGVGRVLSACAVLRKSGALAVYSEAYSRGWGDGQQRAFEQIWDRLKVTAEEQADARKWLEAVTSARSKLPPSSPAGETASAIRSDIAVINRAADDAGMPIPHCPKCGLPLNADDTHRTYEEHDACRNKVAVPEPVPTEGDKGHSFKGRRCIWCCAPTDTENPICDGRPSAPEAAAASDDPFDITDGRNRYAPCSRCGAVLGMGLVSKGDSISVQCSKCNHRGPEVRNNCTPESDKAAFDAWNSVAAPIAPASAIPLTHERAGQIQREFEAADRRPERKLVCGRAIAVFGFPGRDVFTCDLELGHGDAWHDDRRANRKWLAEATEIHFHASGMVETRVLGREPEFDYSTMPEDAL